MTSKIGSAIIVATHLRAASLYSGLEGSDFAFLGAEFSVGLEDGVGLEGGVGGPAAWAAGADGGAVCCRAGAEHVVVAAVGWVFEAITGSGVPVFVLVALVLTAFVFLAGLASLAALASAAAALVLALAAALA